MGTNYYRIPSVSAIEQRKRMLQSRILTMPTTPSLIERGFKYLDDPEDELFSMNPWDEFMQDMSVHLGKRSAGWKFCWNFHDNRYYQDRASLLAFIRSGRVVDEYGIEVPVEEFITMALEWGQPDGRVVDEEYIKQYHADSLFGERHDLEIDGLRVSRSTEFS